ncbi:MAG: hypothetical protein GY787_31720 [Alteromonadales bacterium]|nr:hypothetical protein [Alteromonadales bacterium]
MRFTLSYYEKGSRYNDFNGEDVKVLSVSECGVYTFKSPLLGFGALRLTIEHVKPLTPPVDLTDGECYQFDGYTGGTCKGVYDKSKGCFWVKGKSVQANYRANIQPLTVEK